MALKKIMRAALIGLAVLASAVSSMAAEAFSLPSRYSIDLKPGSDVNRVIQVLQSQKIKVVGSADMPDGPAVWIEIDPNNPPNVAALRPMLPEVQAYAPDVPRKLLALGAGYSDVLLNGETLPWGIQAVQAAQVPFAGNRKVCIIDTGFARGHPDLQTMRVDGIDKGAGKWDGSDGKPLHMHGTHVAGTMAAIGSNGRGVSGVIRTGNLDLFIVRAFGPDATWIYAGELIAAMQDCADAGANVISMSLGSPFASKAEERMVAKLTRQGILLVAAAGNDGNALFHYPASYKGVLSVAAVDSNLTHAYFSQYNTRVQIAAPGVKVLSTVPVGTGFTPHLTVAGVEHAARSFEGSVKTTATGPLVDFGIGDTPDFSVAGKICLIRRGTNQFWEKVVNCEGSGGVGAVIYNNAPGEFTGTLGLLGAITSIPSVSTSDVVGATLMGQLGQLATVNYTVHDYIASDGTSMAVPHVSAVAALVWSHFPGCTANHIRNALRQSALRLSTSGATDYFTGSGLVQAKAAFDYLAANPCLGSGSQYVE
ncbi:S8 family serine peptidase [Piscinibacter sp. XHJ-5]|uniref:S8 family serine peptidase n=1 Tax=Piscinibacter sp. XHJ-5 TaxID=3037797 RepID=UPI002452EADC|nr:S8 family serine peptidase [Piscinibacter sp. XHJ-5]